MSVTHINLQNEKFLVDQISDHAGVFSVIVGDVVSPDVHLHLKLLQIQQQLELL